MLKNDRKWLLLKMSAQNTFFNFRTCTGYSFAHPISDCTQLSAVWPPQISKKSHPELLHLLPCRTIEHRCVRAIVAVYPVHAHGEGWQQVTKWHPYTSEILPSEVDASQNIGVEPVKPESISFPNTVFKEISLIGSLASCISRVCTAALCATTEQLWKQRGWPVLQVAQVYEYQMRLSACITIFRRKGGTKCDDFKLQLWSYFWKPRFTVTEIHQETQVLHQRAILDWNEDILSLPRGRDLNQRRAFGNWQARAAEFCRTSVRLLDLRTFQVWVLVYRNNKLIFKSNLLGIHTAKCSLSSFCFFALWLRKQTLVAFSSWSNDIESPKPVCHLGFCSTSRCLFHQVVDNGLRPCWIWTSGVGFEG